MNYFGNLYQKVVRSIARAIISQEHQTTMKAIALVVPTWKELLQNTRSAASSKQAEADQMKAQAQALIEQANAKINLANEASKAAGILNDAADRLSAA